MGIEHEKAFEDEICDYLHTHGWLYDTDNTGYDKARALYIPDVLGWLEDTQPDQLAKTPDTKAILDRLVKTLDTPIEHGGGTLNVLRRGFKKTPASFTMCEFKPATSLNRSANDRYGKVRLRVMRQVYYSTKNTQSIDLVLFVNGIPVATIELKTDDMQSIDDATAQYRHARDPKGEPLLGFANRCLVHFAVSTDEVAMTTKLTGTSTDFLPFNLGDNGGAGNPVHPTGAASSYLWERVFQRDAWLHILGKLLHIEKRSSTDPITGELTTSTTLLFPRFHQWELVTDLLANVRDEGPGHRYLVQHSAGSGKTNSIAWLAHGLATLHDANDKKVFDTVIVVTDRTVLDDQLQKAIKQIEGSDGTVAMINSDEVQKAGESSKSALLAKELLSGKLIVIVTMQTFPFVLDAIKKNKGLADRRFAIIADEAHSSQTGRTSQKLRAVLTAEEQAELDDGGEIDTEVLLAAEMEARADSPNLSFFAFTATPKAKTLELFGTRGDDGLPHPFHVYSMQQAIEEGYILDVLRNYTTYDTAFQIAETTKQRHLEAVELVDEAEATKGLMRWVSLHPTNIGQKVQIIVEHFRENVRHLLDGHAKAMVVTASREAAVRYKEAIDAYIAKKGYRMATLVAFSGTLTAEQVPGAAFAHAQPPYSESNLNSGMRGRTLPVAFGSDDFQLLIVANKYQTGFDQPLLCAMYVDKRLSGVTAVQTLSRLNRTYAAGGKDTTYILDFVNDPQEILDAFLPYYRTAELTERADPDLIHDIVAKLDGAGIYTSEEVDAFAHAFLAGTTHGAHTGPLKAAAKRFNDRYVDAAASRDKAVLDELDLFRKDVGTFVRLYDFFSQIVDYGDTGLEKRSLFLRLLLPRLTGRAGAEAIDFSAIELTHIKNALAGERKLDLASGEALPLAPVGGAGSGLARDPRLARLADILARINELFSDADFAASAPETFARGVVATMGENDVLRAQADVNSRTQFLESPDLGASVVDALLTHQSGQNGLVDYYFNHPDKHQAFARLLGELLYENLRRERDAG